MVAKGESRARLRATIAASSIPSSIRKLERRLSQLQGHTDITEQSDRQAIYNRIVADVNATIDEVFGRDSADAFDFYVETEWFWAMYTNGWPGERAAFFKGLERSKGCLNAAIDRLKERQEDIEIDVENKTLEAYRGLELHPAIADAASDLYLNGHYSNAIEDAVKALNALVRLRSKEDDKDGAKLMEAVFSPNSPLLRFNELVDQSDRDEQKGFMMLFSGAVAGLRNPRAHRLIQDDPERALEFIAFVSLLAKLLDGAKR